jgi:hypothetical protein
MLLEATVPYIDPFAILQSPAFLLLFVVFWFSFSWILAKRSGWAKLASAYPAPRSLDGAHWSFQSARFGRRASYRGTIHVSADSLGMHLSMFLPFRFGHPPVFVPWTELTGRQDRQSLLGVVVEFIELRFAGAPQVDCQIHGRLADELERASGGIWHYQRI